MKKSITENPHVVPLIRELHGSSPKMIRENVRAAMYAAILNEDVEGAQEQTLSICLKSIIDSPYPINRMWRELDIICMELEHGQEINDLLSRVSSSGIINERIAFITQRLLDVVVGNAINIKVVSFKDRRYKIILNALSGIEVEHVQMGALMSIRSSLLGGCLDGEMVPGSLDLDIIDVAIFETLERATGA